ncbi:DNA-directed RNA polymerase [Lobulomyces angularis]|nr:DNA-directed RNA polymerase [Lobulomyces angularis]
MIRIYRYLTSKNSASKLKSSKNNCLLFEKYFTSTPIFSQEQHQQQNSNNITILPTLFPKLYNDISNDSKILSSTTYQGSVADKDGYWTDYKKPLPYEILQDKYSLMFILIEHGELMKAEMIFHKIYRSNFYDLQKSDTHTQLFNAFIDGFLKNVEKFKTQEDVKSELNELLDSQSAEVEDATTSTELSAKQKQNLNQALEWYDKIIRFKFKPNSETFILFLEAFCKLRDLEKVEEFIIKMQEHQLNPCDVLLDDRFSDNNEVSVIFEAALRKLGHNIDTYQPESDFLLSIVEEEQERNLRTESTTASSPNQNKISSEGKSINLAKKTLEGMKVVKSTRSEGIQLLSAALKKLLQQSDDNPLTKYDQQTWLEEECRRISLIQNQSTSHNMPEFQVRSKLLFKWKMDMIRGVAEYIARARADESDEDYIYQYLLRVEPERYSLITLKAFLKVPTRKGENDEATFGDLNFTNVLNEIGRAVEQEIRIDYLKKKRNREKIKNDYNIYISHKKGKFFNPTFRKVASKITNDIDKKNSEKIWLPEMTTRTQILIGNILASILLDVAKVEVMNPETSEITLEPAFQHYIATKYNRQEGRIRAHPKVLEDIVAGDSFNSTPSALPMIVMPKPWLNVCNGGYFTEDRKIKLVKTNSRLQKNLLRDADRKIKLQKIFHSLDVLGSTPWRINKKTLEVILTCWNEGGAWPGIPSVAKLPPVEKPADYKTNPASARVYRNELKKRNDAEKGRYSQRCDSNYKVLIAKAFENETIYFPHHIDFRGRAYPLPVHLNHIGNDLCRGLLLFDEAKPLGVNGLKWLKIQVANLYGNDKISFMDRVTFVEENIENVFDSADNPLKGRRWWLGADDPWQCLATCMELVDALRSPDPTKFMSRMPIHQDGTCNGLQHYAALGGDVAGAQQVNLIPSDKPSDVYTGIADKVNEFVIRDAKSGVEEAILLQGKINRKIVKQTVMTNTYGVTFIGARDQVRNRLKEANDKNKLTEVQLEKCSLYVTKRIFESFGEVFKGASAIQKWLSQTAKLISECYNKTSLTQYELEEMTVLESLGAEIKSTYLGNLDEEKSQASRKKKSNSEEVEEDVISLNELINSAKLDNINVFNNDNNFVQVDSDFQDRLEGKKFRATSVVWTNPLGLPISQPYRNVKKVSVGTTDDKLRNKNQKSTTITDIDGEEKYAINHLKQASAFPPNFIHSLDASHMMMTAIKCKKDDITFASVHDSYWCHAKDVDHMSLLLRESFVDLHKVNLMKLLRREFLYRGKNLVHKVTYKLPMDKIEEWKKYIEKRNKEIVKNNSILKLDEEEDDFFNFNIEDFDSENSPSENNESTKKVNKPRVFFSSKFEKTGEVESYAEFKKLVTKLPNRGDFDINMVKDSKYFFH